MKPSNAIDLQAFWALKPSVFESLRTLVPGSEVAEKPKVGFGTQADESRPYQVKDGVAVLPIQGVIRNKTSFWSWFFGGGYGLQELDVLLAQALNDPDVGAILLDVNSPGGELDGTPEFMESIRSAREIKPVHAYVSRMGDSAAYWIASAAESITLHKTAEVGCLGVICEFYKYEDDPEVISIASSSTPNKVVDVESEKGRAQIQAQLDTLASIFMEDVAENRQVPVDKVLKDFGGGDVVIGEEAVARGMADQVGNFKTAWLLAVEAAKFKQPNVAPGIQGVSMNKNNESAAPRAEMIDSEEITQEYLQENMPELYESILDEGRSQERDRVSEIDDVESDDSDETEALRKSARRDPEYTAGRFAMEVLASQRKRTSESLAARNADAEAIPTVASAEPEVPATGESSDDQEYAAIGETVKNFMAERS